MCKTKEDKSEKFLLLSKIMKNKKRRPTWNVSFKCFGPSTGSANLCADGREGKCLSVGVVGFEAIGRCSPLNRNSLRLALRAQPLRLGHARASTVATLALRGCRQRCNYLTASTKTFSPSASDSCKPAVESFQMIALA